MAVVSAEFRRRWRSMRHVGAYRPTQVVKIRTGSFRHRYDSWPHGGVHATIPGAEAHHVWQAFWEPHDDWRTLPNVVEVNMDQDFNNNGVSNCTVVMDNVAYEERTGATGTFHRIVRGFFAPLRGYTRPAAPNRTGQEKNDWFRYLNRPVQVEVWQGYGDELVRVFTGLAEQLDLRSMPDQGTITARDFGQALTDQHLLGKVKNPSLYRKPIVFADRNKAYNEIHEGSAGGAHDCSSMRAGHPPRLVTDEKHGSSTAWYSHNMPSSDNTEWVQVHLPAGTYREFFLEPGYGEMTAYVSVKAVAGKHGAKPKVDGVEVDPGWLNLPSGGTVPGPVDGQIPYIKGWRNLSHKGRKHNFHGHTLTLHDNSLLRISFRDLRKVHEDGHTHYRAACKRLYGIRRKKKHEAKKNGWILVDDYSDVVKVCLRWAGFKEWNVESTGARLVATEKNGAGLTFSNGDTLMDVIKKVQEITNFCFFMGDPSGSNDTTASIGVPVFRSPNVLGLGETAAEVVRDTDLLTGMQVKWMGGDTLPEVIYVMGSKISDIKKKKGRPRPRGRTIGADPAKRVRGKYLPPWARRKQATVGTSSGILRHFVSPVYTSLKTQKEVDVAARFVAMNAALQSLTGIIEIPGHPGINLDDVVGVDDNATGTNTRIYVATRSSTFRQGQETSWRTTVGGALLDNPDLVAVVKELRRALNKPELRGVIHIGTAAGAGASGGVAAGASGGVVAVGGRSRGGRRRRPQR